jgi:hypothetical protein
MIEISSRREDIAATIVQAPFTDGIASARNLIARLLGRPRVLVPLAAPPGLPALMTNSEVVGDILALVPQGSRMSERLSSLYMRFAARAFAWATTCRCRPHRSPTMSRR